MTITSYGPRPAPGLRHGVRRAATLLAASGLVVALLGQGALAVSAADPVVFKMGTTRQPSGVNPFYGSGWATIDTWEALVAVQTDSPDYKFPLFAESWSSNEDATVWTFKIRPDLKWSDGEPATAQDVVFTYTFMKDAQDTEYAVPTLANLDAIEKVEAPDPLTAVFTLKGPADILTGVLNNSPILPEHVWGSMTPEQASTYTDIPSVGTGPWVAEEWQQGQFIRLVKNPNYRGPGPFVDEIVAVFYATPDAEANALKSGEIDLAFEVPLASLDQLAATENVKTVAATLGAYQALSFNQMTGDGKGSTSALLDQKFRDALGYAIDKDALVDGVLGGHGAPMQSLVTEFAGSYRQPLTGIERTFDLEKAKQQLEAAGYVDGDGDGIREDKDGNPLDLNMLVQQGAQMAIAGQYIADWFGQVGVQVTANAVEEGTFWEKAMSLEGEGGGGWDLVVEQTYQNPWPGDFLVWWTTGRLGVMNASHWTNPDYDAIVAEVLTTADSAALHDLADRALRIIYTEAPIIPLYENYWLQAYRTDKFEGFTGCASPEGLVTYCMPPDLTLYNIRPVGTAASEEPSAEAPSTPAESTAPSATAAASPAPGSTAGSDNTGLIIGGAAVVVAIAAFVLLRRRSSAG